MSVDLCDYKGNTLLMLASYNGNIETVKLLIDNKALVTLSGPFGAALLAWVLGWARTHIGTCFRTYRIRFAYNHLRTSAQALMQEYLVANGPVT